MVDVKFVIDDEIVLETKGLMLDYWETEKRPEWLEVAVIGEVKPTEKVWLDRLLRWVYKTYEGQIRLNGDVYNIADLINNGD